MSEKTENDFLHADKAADLWAEQNAILWSRLKTAALIEAGSLIAVYTAWDKGKYFFIPILILICSTLLLIGVCLLMHRDEQYINTFRQLAKFERPSGSLKGKHIAVSSLIVLMAFNFITALYLAFFGFFWFQRHFGLECTSN